MGEYSSHESHVAYQGEYFSRWEKDTMFYVFYRNANDMLVLIQTDNMLIIWVWVF
jgi:hypothetical protein